MRRRPLLRFGGVCLFWWGWVWTGCEDAIGVDAIDGGDD